MKKILFLGGNWIENIRESGYIKKLYEDLLYRGFYIDCYNGGTAEQLKQHLKNLVDYDVVLWFVNVPNTYEKIVDLVKQYNKKIILVTSKSNLESKYSYMELIARMLKVKANLLVEFTRESVNLPVLATVLDPLGNAYCMKVQDIHGLAIALIERIRSLLCFTRAESVKVGEALPIPDETEFFEIGKRLAETFHTLVHPEHTERFLGNMSFRCENGFPSFRWGRVIYVSRRNIDKRLIGKDGFVAVNADFSGRVEYYGDAKPSVDTPIQVKLYSYFRNVRYMIHSHVYSRVGPICGDPIPCGALDEYDNICAAVPDSELTNFAVNLCGHGSIVFASDLDYFNQIEYVARPCPEIQRSLNENSYNTGSFLIMQTLEGL